MQVQVSKDDVSILNTDLTHVGEYNVDKLTFIFSQEYTDDLVKCAIFTNNAGKSYQTSILNNECFIPAEVLQERGNVIFGVYAYKVIEDKLELRYSPHPTYFDVLLGSYNQDVEESQEITPTQFEQYMQALNDGLNQVKDSISELNQATDNANDLVDEINKKLENGDFIGPQGPIGPQGEPGKDGTNGIDGVGITTITSGQATEENGNTITPITVEKTDGSSETFNVSAKNGIDGKNGQNGKDGINGTNGIDGQDGITPNIQIGTVETLEPTEEATVTRTGTDEEPVFNFGIPKGEKGEPGEITEETLDNVVPKQIATDSIININDALKYKTFDFKIDGAYKQTTYQGKNLANFSSLYCPILTGSLENQEATINGTTEQNTNVTLEFKKENVNLKANQPYTISVICSGTVTGGTYKKLYLSFNENDSIEIGEYSSNHTTTYTFTPDTDMQVRSINMDISLGQTFNNLKVKVQIEEGSTATDYEPYVGGVAVPNPNQPSEITTLNFDKIMKAGKNMLNVHLDETTSNGVTMNVDNQFIHINGKTSNKDGFRIITNTCLLPAGTYSINMQVVEGNVESTSTGYLFGIYKGTSWDICAFLIIPSNSKKANLSFILDEPTEVCLGLYARDSETYNNVKIAYQLTLGTKPDYEFEPYQGNDFSIYLQGNEMVSLPNGVKDEVQIDKSGNVNLIKKVGKKTLIDTDVVDITDDWFTNLAYSNIPKPTDYKGYNSYDMNLSYNNVVMNKFYMSPDSTPKETYDKVYSFISFMSVWSMGLTFPKGTTLEQAREMTAGTVMYYELAESQTINLGKLSDIIKTEKGSNTFAINGNIDTQISTTYALDLKKYIDNKIATVSTAVIGE